MRRRWRWIGGLTALALVSGCSSPHAAPPSSDTEREIAAVPTGASAEPTPARTKAAASRAPVRIDVVTVNDIHGRLRPTGDAAGLAVLGGLVKKVEKQNPNTIVVGAGDLINGKGAGSSKKTVRALDRIGLAASALGNHEFDNGVDAIDELKAGFPYLSVNAVDSTGRRVFDAYRIVNVGGVAVGFIGATTRDTKPVDGVRFTGIVRAVNAVASQLTDGRKGNGEADVVILLVHEGAATSSISTARDGSEFGTITRKVTSKVDAIVGAHSHRSYAHRIAAPDGHKRPVVSAGVYGSHYGRLIFEVSAGGKVTATGGVHNLIGAAKPDAAIARIVD